MGNCEDMGLLVFLKKFLGTFNDITIDIYINLNIK